MVRGSREDALGEDSQYHVPSVTKQPLLHHRRAAGKGPGTEALIFGGLPAKRPGDAKL